MEITKGTVLLVVTLVPMGTTLKLTLQIMVTPLRNPFTGTFRLVHLNLRKTQKKEQKHFLTQAFQALSFKRPAKSTE